MLLFETGELVAATAKDYADKFVTCLSTDPLGGSVPIPAGSLGVVLKQDERWISVLFACVGLTLWVWHEELLRMPPDALTEPENILNGSEGVKIIQQP